jgi:hypothetical protein
LLLLLANTFRIIIGLIIKWRRKTFYLSSFGLILLKSALHEKTANKYDIVGRDIGNKKIVVIFPGEIIVQNLRYCIMLIHYT